MAKNVSTETNKHCHTLKNLLVNMELHQNDRKTSRHSFFKETTSPKANIQIFN